MPAPPVLRPLHLYRRLLRLAARLPAAESSSALARVRAAFRAGAGETSPEAVRALLSDANARLGYLRIVTPRARDGEDEVAGAGASSGSGSRRYVVSAAGELVPVDGGGGGGGGGGFSTYAGGRSLDEADVRRHRANIDRFHFGARR